MTPVTANDGGVTVVNAAPENGSTVAISPPASGDPDGSANTGWFNSGPYGLGDLGAMGQGHVRPFRRLISSQSLFRREVFAQ